ncbi:dienelactone hydrolase family protein [bacterium]|nr:dienelactone hydrolase family protein [bacterium]
MKQAGLILIVTLLLAMNLFAQPEVGERESYAERAERALVAGDFPVAVDLYQRWLEADPDDFRNWYNYACALALGQDTSAASEALSTAVDMGWRDSTWTARDPDLTHVISLPEFQASLVRMGKLWRDEQASVVDAEPRYARQQRYAPYLLHLPRGYDRDLDKRYPLLVLLHGRGADMESMDNLRERLALPGVIVVQPRAPYTVEEGRGGYEYWPARLQNEYGDTLLRAIRDDAGQWVQDVIASVKQEARVDDDHVIVTGFSQGGAAAVLTAMQDPSTLAGLALVAGYIPETHRDSTFIAPLAYSDLSVFMAHGRRDHRVEPSEAEAFYSTFQQAGVQVQFNLYPAEHEMTDEMIVDLADWIMVLCRKSRN